MKLLRRLLVLLGAMAVALLAILFAPFTALAQAVPVGPDSQVDSLFKLDPFIVEFLLGTAIPFVVAAVTDWNTVAWVKKLLTAALAAVTGIITAGLVADGGAWISESAVKAAFLAFMGAITGYVGIVRNSKVETGLQKIPLAIGPKAA